MDNLILYEHPMNETTRVCLRIESLFAQLTHYLHNEGYWNIRASVASIVELSNVLDRPDFKNKLTKQLMNHKENLSQHLHDEQVDQPKLQQILRQLDESTSYLQNITGKLNQTIEQDEFLNSVKLRLSTAGGARNFDLPMYHFWLNQSEAHCQHDLQQWLVHFTPIQQIIKLLLLLTRQSGQFLNLMAESGYYEKNLDTSVDFQLLRIHTAANATVFPDVSVGRHRLSIHFFCLNTAERPVQFREDVHFELACCI